MRRGVKTSEGRCNTGMFERIQTGDTIKFFEKKNPSNFVIIEVVSKQKYKTFRDLVVGEGITKLLPELSEIDIEKAVKIYKNIPGYKEKETRFGTVALRLKFIS